MKGLKKAVGDYQRANRGGNYSPRYAHLMYNPATREIWTDEFYSLGRNWWKAYDDPNIVCVEREMFKEIWDSCEPLVINMRTVRDFIERRYGK